MLEIVLDTDGNIGYSRDMIEKQLENIIEILAEEHHLVLVGVAKDALKEIQELRADKAYLEDKIDSLYAEIDDLLS